MTDLIFVVGSSAGFRVTTILCLVLERRRTTPFLAS